MHSVRRSGCIVDDAQWLDRPRRRRWRSSPAASWRTGSRWCSASGRPVTIEISPDCRSWSCPGWRMATADPRTVEWNLRKVFSKVGISSQKQLRLALPKTTAAVPPDQASSRGAVVPAGSPAGKWLLPRREHRGPGAVPALLGRTPEPRPIFSRPGLVDAVVALPVPAGLQAKPSAEHLVGTEPSGGHGGPGLLTASSASARTHGSSSACNGDHVRRGHSRPSALVECIQ